MNWFESNFAPILDNGLVARALLGIAVAIVSGLGFGWFFAWATGRKRSETAASAAVCGAALSIGATTTDGALVAPIPTFLLVTALLLLGVLLPLFLWRFTSVLWAWISSLTLPVTLLVLAIVGIVRDATKAPPTPVPVDKPDTVDAGPLPSYVPAECFKADGNAVPYTGRGIEWCPPDGDFPGVPSCPGGYFFVPIANGCFASEADIPGPPAPSTGEDVVACVCATGRDERNERGGCTWTNPVRERMGVGGLDVPCVCPMGYAHATVDGIMNGEPCARVATAEVDAGELPTPPKGVAR